MRRKLTINGLTYLAEYRDQDVNGIFLPLIDEWSRLREQVGRRVVVLLAAPPGTGKTTLAHVLTELGNERQDRVSFQALGMDGFHFSNEYLDSHTIVEDGERKTLRQRKGAPFTFDVNALSAALRDARLESPRPWPDYSRVLHDVVPGVLPITGDVLIVEGNYLLLDAPSWRDLARLADCTVFLSAEESFLRERLISRKVAGGMDPQSAKAWYQASDGRNVSAVLERRLPADIELRVKADGGIEECSVFM